MDNELLPQGKRKDAEEKLALRLLRAPLRELCGESF